MPALAIFQLYGGVSLNLNIIFVLFIVVYCSTMNSNISKALFADYDSGLRPVCGDTTQVNATLGMALRQVIDMVNCVKLSQLYYANMHMHEMVEQYTTINKTKIIFKFSVQY
jgi:hypothetical protein